MNLYLLYRSFRPGEASTNRALSYFHALSKLGIKATVVYLLPDKNHSVLKEQIGGINFVYYWEGQNSKSKYLSYLQYVFHIIKLLTRIKKGDIVYIYDNADLLEWMSKKKNISLYYEVTEHPSINPPRRRLGSMSMKHYYNLCKRMAGLFVISRALKDLYEEHGVDCKRIGILNVTVDEERFAGLVKDESQKYIAYCGTVLNDKDGVDVLIKAFALFHERHPEFKLKIIGKTPPSYIQDRNSNQELIASLGIENEVILTGQVQPEKMPQLLKNASALVLARPDNLQAKYGFPTKLGEYLLTENPVVVTSVGDIPLFLTDHVNAYMTEPDDIEGIAKQLCRIVENPEEAAEIGRKGANVARQYFNNITEVKKMLSMMDVDICKE